MKTDHFMRIILLATIATSLLAAGAGGQSVNAAANGALSIVDLKVQPQPVVAGDNVTIIFQLYNSYSSALTNVNLQLTAQNPILNVSPSSSQLIDAIGQGLYGGGIGFTSFVYKFRVPSTLSAGEYTIDAIAKYQTSQPNSYGGTTALPAESDMPIYIYVYGVPDVKLSASPQAPIVPGQAASLPVSVVNTGTDIANNVTVTLYSTNAFSVFGTSRFYVGTIKEDSASSFTATVQPSLDIANGTYPINATITYTSQSGNVVNESTSILLSTLINKPNIVASIEGASPTNLYAGGNQTLQVRLQNTGLGTAKNVTARFLDGPGINVGSTSQFFMSSLSPNNYTTETVYISANRSDIIGNFSLPVSLTYYRSNYSGSVMRLQYIPINIQKSAVFNVTGVAGSLQPGAAYKPVTFTITNIGNEAAEQVTLSLQTTFPITPVNPNVYINALLPGQSTNATFYVGVDTSGNPGSYPVTLFEQWRQPNGAVSQVFSGSNGYYAAVASKSGTSSLVNTAIEAVVAVAVIGFAAYMIRRRMAPRKKKA